MPASAPAVRREHTWSKLLAQLPSADAERVRRSLEPVHLARGQVLVRPGEPQEHVYFPAGCLVSVFVVYGTSRRAHVGLIGSEGFVGLPILLGCEPDPHQLVCQIAGGALRMPSQTFRAVLNRRAALRRLLYRYASVRLNEEAQSLACFALHPVSTRLTRWLLIIHDRIDSDDLPLTQDFLAQIVAVRRPYLSELLRDLRRSGLVKYQRGTISIRNLPALASRACEDYWALRAVYERLFGPQAPIR